MLFQLFLFLFEFSYIAFQDCYVDGMQSALFCPYIGPGLNTDL